MPRHHSRLYLLPETNVPALVGELFIPVSAARSFTDELLSWAADQNIEEIAVLHGVPFPHGPEEHDVFFVVTPEYRDCRLAEESVKPLKGGFLDGVVGDLVTRSLDDDAPDVGVFVTPARPLGSDIDAALKLLTTAESVYEFDVDETELSERGEQLRQYHEQLADRMESFAESEGPLASHDYPEDRM